MRFIDFYNSLFEENLTRPATRNVWMDRLESKGWRWAGGGAYGEVYTRHDKDYVIKLYRNDPGYSTFLDFIELENQSNNPCVVKIRRNIFRDDTSSFNPNKNTEAIALEKLVPLQDTDHYFFGMIRIFVFAFRQIKIGNQTFEKVFDNVVQAYKEESQKVMDMYPKQHYNYKLYKRMLRSLPTFMNRFYPLIKTIFLLKQFMEKNGGVYNFDLHGNNFMVRPSTGQIVITDPLSSKDGKFDELK